ncbi:hypothetical protein HDV63DRAFT_387975, partial [Trichoderma sp. SZMC 28014]
MQPWPSFDEKENAQKSANEQTVFWFLLYPFWVYVVHDTMNMSHLHEVVYVFVFCGFLTWFHVVAFCHGDNESLIRNRCI